MLPNLFSLMRMLLLWRCLWDTFPGWWLYMHAVEHLALQQHCPVLMDCELCPVCHPTQGDMQSYKLKTIKIETHSRLLPKQFFILIIYVIAVGYNYLCIITPWGLNPCFICLCVPTEASGWGHTLFSVSFSRSIWRSTGQAVQYLLNNTKRNQNEQTTSIRYINNLLPLVNVIS